MAQGRSKPGQIHLKIIEVMKRFPDGLSGGQIREELAKEGLLAEQQTHLDRRKRDLNKWFLIGKETTLREAGGKKYAVIVYKYLGERKKILDQGQVNLQIRAEVIHSAHGRCQMCGRDVEHDGVKLVVDHKKPRVWGGTNDRANLWAICVECNAGKKDYFSSLNAKPETMRKVMDSESVHVRIGELLKASGVGKRTPSSLLEVVANQDDWQKRLLELRYPVIGWEIDTHLYKGMSGKKQSDYILRSYAPWPDNPAEAIRKFEIERHKKNKKSKT